MACIYKTCDWRARVPGSKSGQDIMTLLHPVVFFPSFLSSFLQRAERVRVKSDQKHLSKNTGLSCNATDDVMMAQHLGPRFKIRTRYHDFFFLLLSSFIHSSLPSHRKTHMEVRLPAYLNDLRCQVHENTTGFLKNHWTKHKLACKLTCYDAISMLILYGHEISNIWSVWFIFQQFCNNLNLSYAVTIHTQHR